LQAFIFADTKYLIPMKSLIRIGLLALICWFSACKTDTKTNNTQVTTILEADPDRLNIMLASTGYANDVCKYIFYPLLEIDPFTLELTPVLVKSTPTASNIREGKYKGMKSYDFEMLPNVKWDDGSLVTGNDYLFTLKAAFNPNVNAEKWRAPLGFIRDVVVDPKNPQKFQVITESDYFLADLLVGNINVYPEYIYDPEGLMKDFSLFDLTEIKKIDGLMSNTNLIKFAELFQSNPYSRDPAKVSGCGPYQLENWTNSQQIVLKKKDNWWGDKSTQNKSMLAAYPSKLVFKIVPDEAAVLALLKTGSIDALGGVSPASFTELKKEKAVTDNYDFFTPTTLQYYYFALNNKDPLLADVKLRIALSHLLNMDQILELFDGLGERIVGPFHPSKSYYNKDLKPIQFDPAFATKILASAGWKDSDGDGILDNVINGKKTPLKLTISLGANSEIGKKLSLMLQENAKKVGIEITLDARDMASVMADIKLGKFQISPLKNRLNPVLDDPYLLWHCNTSQGGGGNKVGYCNPAADVLIDKIRTTTDVKIRNELYLQFQKIMYEDQPVIFLYAPKEPVLIHKKWKEAKASAIKPGFALNYFN